MSAIAAGDELPTIEHTHELADSVRYAGASGDMNPLHYDPEFARTVPPAHDVIAHGMFSMGLASRLVTEFAGGPERVRALKVRFTRPWVTGTTVTFGGTVQAVDGGVARITLWGRGPDGEAVLKGTAEVAVQD